MAISVSADPIGISIFPVPNTEVWAGPILLTVRPNQPVVSHFPAAARNTLLDQTIDAGYEEFTDSSVEVTITGSWFNVSVSADPIEIVISPLGSFPEGELWLGDNPISLVTSLGSPSFYGESQYANVVSWSKIGYLDFTIDRKNSAGKARMEWSGRVFCLKKLGNMVMCYGAGGVTRLIPKGNTYGQIKIASIGLKGKQAVCGNDSEHFYIDTMGVLWRVTDKIERLGYEEFLNSLVSTVTMSFDEINRLIYICDGIIGFIYSIDSGSFSIGPNNVVFAGYYNNLNGIIISGASTIPGFGIITDTYDFGTKKYKTIYTVELGASLLEDLYVSIYHREHKEDAFSLSKSVLVTKQGIAHIPCYGLEFRFRIESTTAEAFSLDYINITGMIHGYVYPGSMIEV